jgi:cation diffusion facilitator CzcD-associated flavoprotein CzcO
MLYGPNTNLAHNSIVYMLESQMHYILACIGRLYRDDVRSIAVKKESQDRYNARLQRRLEKATWSKGCSSWYLTAAGRNVTNWPGYSLEFRLRTRAPNWNDYVVG